MNIEGKQKFLKGSKKNAGKLKNTRRKTKIFEGKQKKYLKQSNKKYLKESKKIYIYIWRKVKKKIIEGKQ